MNAQDLHDKLKSLDIQMLKILQEQQLIQEQLKHVESETAKNFVNNCNLSVGTCIICVPDYDSSLILKTYEVVKMDAERLCCTVVEGSYTHFETLTYRCVTECMSVSTLQELELDNSMFFVPKPTLRFLQEMLCGLQLLSTDKYKLMNQLFKVSDLALSKLVD